MNRRSPSTITRWPWRFGDINTSDSVFWTHSEVVLLMPTALLASHQEKIQDIWKEKKKIRRVRHKPGSVLGQCQGQLSIWDDCYQSPLAVHQNGIGKRPTWFHRPCSQPGFTEPVPLDTAGALLPSPLHPYLNFILIKEVNKAVFFCGTLLAIARTGNYPASLVFRESGLSSNLSQRTNLQLPRQLSRLSSLLSIDRELQLIL